MIVRLGYTVSLDVLVDLDDNSIRSVVLYGGLLDESGDGWDEDGNEASPEMIERAQDVADTNEWPAWDWC